MTKHQSKASETEASETKPSETKPSETKPSETRAGPVPPDGDDASTASSTASRDLVLVGGRVPESGGLRVLRQRADRLEVGELRNIQEGRPLAGEVVKLHPTERHERIFECETLHEATPTRAQSGPPQVASDAYRRNWEAIFGELAAAIEAEDDGLSLEDGGAPEVTKLN